VSLRVRKISFTKYPLSVRGLIEKKSAHLLPPAEESTTGPHTSHVIAIVNIVLADNVVEVRAVEVGFKNLVFKS